MSSQDEPTSSSAHDVGLTLVSRLAALLLRLLGATWRVEVRGTNPVEAARRDTAAPTPIGALWHRSILIAAWFFRDRNICAGISRSNDGDWVSALLRRLGYVSPARGSSSSGGAEALRELVRHARAGTAATLIVDGPRGPARRAKPGVAALARLSGCPIHPVAISARPATRFASWDGTLLPWPFARVVIVFAEPIPVASDERDPEAIIERVDDALNAATDRLDDALRLIDANRRSADRGSDQAPAAG